MEKFPKVDAAGGGCYINDFSAPSVLVFLQGSLCMYLSEPDISVKTNLTTLSSQPKP